MNSLFSKQLIFLDCNIIDQKELFEKISKDLFSFGFVKESFLSSIQQREKDYPTCLPIMPNPVALPHTTIEHVNKPFICFIRLKKQIDWREMGNDDRVLQTKLIFLLGFTEHSSHVTLLELLMNQFSNDDFISKLIKINNIPDCYQFFNDTFNDKSKENVI